MNWLDGDHVVTPTEAFENWKLCFLCVGPCRGYITRVRSQLDLTRETTEHRVKNHADWR
jgi:hypothetical protein